MPLHGEWGRVDTLLPQPPQLLTSFEMLTSQPLVVMLSQLAKLQWGSRKAALQSPPNPKM
jgi:hypothetical protein